MKKQVQIESELRSVLKKSKKSVFVNLSLTDFIEASRRMYVIYNSYKSGVKFKLNNNDEVIEKLNNINLDFDSLSKKLKNIPSPIKDLLDRKWEQDLNSKESIYGSSEIIFKKINFIKNDFNNLTKNLNKDFKSGAILNVDPIPLAITHSAMTIWVDVLKNKVPAKNSKKINKHLLSFLQNIFDVFTCQENVSKSFYDWQNIK